MTTYYRIDVKPPGSPGWLRFLSYDDYDAAKETAERLIKDPKLYQEVKIKRVTEEEMLSIT